jgi:hypothetical protein
MILGKQGVTLEMEFKCSTCGEKISGARIIAGEYLYIVSQNKENPEKSVFRCECCQDEVDDCQD